MLKTYKMKPKVSTQKRRGGYYTPSIIADFLASWAIRSGAASVLEPSCGDGEILQSAIKVLSDYGALSLNEQLLGIEVDEHEAIKGRERIESLGLPLPPSIHHGDFFTYCLAHLSDRRHFEAIIGNPPFIRYQNFPEEHRKPAFEIMKRAGLKPTRLTNAWMPFIVAAALLLEKEGRLAMVVPAELLQVGYAAELRLFLSNYFQRITLVTFRRLVFDGIQQEIVLLLAEKDGGLKEGIATIELDNAEDLTQLSVLHNFNRREVKPLDHSKHKWTQYFLDASEICLLREVEKHKKLVRAGDFLQVDVGIVTGQNSFFVVNKEELERNALGNYARKIVSRSGHLKGVVFTSEDWKAIDSENLATNLLDLPRVEFDALPVNIRSYVAHGQRAEVHTGYKCRIRNPWYVVPSPWVPDAFMLRQIHMHPKIIVNSAAATCTDTIHRVKLRNGRTSEDIASAFLNSLTFAFSEVLGRSYGGGVLELEPSEAESLLIPKKGSELLDVTEIHDLVLQNRIDDVLDLTDKIILRKYLGFSVKDTQSLRSIWRKLRDRRLNRKAARSI